LARCSSSKYHRHKHDGQASSATDGAKGIAGAEAAVFLSDQISFAQMLDTNDVPRHIKRPRRSDPVGKALFGFPELTNVEPMLLAASLSLVAKKLQRSMPANTLSG
jgi:hypothetical protein